MMPVMMRKSKNACTHSDTERQEGNAHPKHLISDLASPATEKHTPRLCPHQPHRFFQSDNFYLTSCQPNFSQRAGLSVCVLLNKWRLSVLARSRALGIPHAHRSTDGSQYEYGTGTRLGSCGFEPLCVGLFSSAFNQFEGGCLNCVCLHPLTVCASHSPTPGVSQWPTRQTTPWCGANNHLFCWDERLPVCR